MTDLFSNDCDLDICKQQQRRLWLYTVYHKNNTFQLLFQLVHDDLEAFSQQPLGS